jgi:hypothetical protein
LADRGQKRTGTVYTQGWQPPTMTLLTAAGEVTVQTGVIDVVGWALTLGGVLVTALWLRHLSR